MVWMRRLISPTAALREAGACAPGLAWFAEHHPAGATWRDLVTSLAHRPVWAVWAVWAACLGWHCPAGVEGDPRSHRAHAIDLDELDDVEPCELCGERPVTHHVRCSDGGGVYGYCDICDPPRDGDIT